MSNDLVPLSSLTQMPAHLRELMEIDVWNNMGASSFPRIEIADRRIKAILNNTEVASSKDPITVVLIDAGPVGRTFYKKEFVKGSKERPDCYSNDGVRPSESAAEPQHVTCDGCPQNIKGSSRAMGDSKACRYRQNVVGWIPNENEPVWNTLFRISLPSTAIFPDEVNDDGYRPLRRYFREISASGGKPLMVWTSLAIDDYQDQPRLLFKSIDWIQDPVYTAQIKKLAQSPEIPDMLKIINDNGSTEHETPHADPLGLGAPPAAAQVHSLPSATGVPSSRTRRSAPAAAPTPSLPTAWPAGVGESDFEDGKDTYWYHAATDTYFMVPAKELLPDDSVCEELTQAVFISDVEMQRKEIEQEQARLKEEAARKQAEEEARIRAEEEARRVAEEARRIAAEEEARKKAEEEAAAAASSRRRRSEPPADAAPAGRTRRGSAVPQATDSSAEQAPAGRSRRPAPTPEPVPEANAAPTGRSRRSPAAETAEDVTPEPVKDVAPVSSRRRTSTGTETPEPSPAPEAQQMSSRRRTPVPQEPRDEVKDVPAKDAPVTPPKREAAGEEDPAITEAPQRPANGNLSALESIILNENPDD